jgi:hypothetical protein
MIFQIAVTLNSGFGYLNSKASLDVIIAYYDKSIKYIKEMEKNARIK